MKAEVEMVKGAMAADDKRLSDAAVRVWSEHRWGCDTPDHMADTILALRDDAKRLREAVEVALPRFCANTCEHDDNYGSVKYHDMECANIRRLLGQDVGENGRIRDAGEEKRI